MGDPIEFARRNLSTFFAQQSDRFRFEGIIAHGANGVTFQDENIKRRVCSEGGSAEPQPVENPWKIGAGWFDKSWISQSEPGNISEQDNGNKVITWFLGSVNGSIHIARLIAYRDDPPPVARRLAKSHPIARGPLSKGDFLAGLSGPVLVLEYLDNGTLRRLVDRIKRREEPTPNPVRAVVALAYPQGYEPDSSPRLERIPGPDVAPSRLVHGDLHSKNIMFGTTEPSLSEHRYFPIMKFIDLGCAQEEDRAVEENLADVAEVIYHVIIAQLSTENLPRRVEAKYKNISTYAVHISAEATTPIRNVDPDLIDLVCRSLAANVEDRPGLRDTLYRTSQAVSNKTGASYLLYETAESDRDIQQFLQEMIYDTTPKSSPPPTPPPSSPPPHPPPGDIQAPIVITISDS
ncbi:hypothetical protein F5Y08DRAFT_338491 [Xylaria arbuscula]|nr:hypothetical protein F5Y08DRAFT_338491 [Xylaria arbuscula]